MSALLAARTPWVLLVACDMPFVTVEAAQALIAAAGEADVTCYRRGAELEPMLAVYRAALGAPWRARLPENPSLRALIASVKLLALEAADPRALESINTVDQLRSVKS